MGKTTDADLQKCAGELAHAFTFRAIRITMGIVEGTVAACHDTGVLDWCFGKLEPVAALWDRTQKEAQDQ